MMTPEQDLLYGNNIKGGAYDKLTQFGLRPVELIQLFPMVGPYFRWFEIEDQPMDPSEIERCLDIDIVRCGWVDGLGRKVLLRKRALIEVKTHLQGMVDRDISHTSRRLGWHLIDLINDGNDDEKFVFTDVSKVLPIPVFSSITPKTPVPFLLHIMLMLGEYDTELDLKMQPTM